MNWFHIQLLKKGRETRAEGQRKKIISGEFFDGVNPIRKLVFKGYMQGQENPFPFSHLDSKAGDGEIKVHAAPEKCSCTVEIPFIPIQKEKHSFFFFFFPVVIILPFITITTLTQPVTDFCSCWFPYVISRKDGLPKDSTLDLNPGNILGVDTCSLQSVQMGN